MLEKPDPGDWINWRRTYDGTGYSPLTQINRQNVGQLQLAWSWGMPAGAHQPTPLVHDGVMFLPTPGGGAQAVDATNGDFLWEFRSPRQREGNGNVRTTPTRNIAIYGDKIYVTTGDARLIALNARTGDVVWDTQVVDPKLGYTYTAGALAVKGVIITSLTGCQLFKNESCYILGHDAQTGKELWRTSTDCAAGGTRRRHLGQSAADVPRRRRRLDDGQLRSRDEPGLLGHGAGEAVGAVPARHRRRRALHEQHARARPEDGQDGLVLPAHPRRDARHGRGVRAGAGGRQRTLVLVLYGQAGDALGDRPEDRQIRRRARPGIPDADRRRSEDRPSRVPRRTQSRKRAWSSDSARAQGASRACARWRITRRRARSTSR